MIGGCVFKILEDTAARRALRLSFREWRAQLRSGRLALCVMTAGGAGAALAAQDLPQGPIDRARYDAPTTRYPHGVLGDAVEHGALVIQYAGQPTPHILTLPPERVFEDVAPRLADLDGDGQQEVVVVESHRDLGARLAVYNGAGLVAATPYIGQRFRWLAPVGVADLDGDGLTEIAYIDRPHLAKVLRIWRFEDGRLRQVARRAGFTNHRIGDTGIAGGIRRCGGAPEIIVADADWQRIVALGLAGGALTARDAGPHRGPADFTRALAC
ncbi:VCBS repeat-containing protein [Sulfitobacter sp. G21635-S1]|uniref:FG-GAP repeat domain-containing protein n=1 Tax=Sulfitobacter sp. G21635-S1 TaxID=3014043 RepID=UPI0022AE8595|nr:VCBS repeat-containing protein [Sulfitobacter sp. G21635-S1]MCZ4256114.1 VCBS repeat-containing protein [Sulfitobacter sp. G21635-S1]